MEQYRSPFGRSAVPWDPASSHSDSWQLKFDGDRISGDEARLSKWASPCERLSSEPTGNSKAAATSRVPAKLS